MTESSKVEVKKQLPPQRRYPYSAIGAEIYRQSFATIRHESDLTHIPLDAETIAVRIIHGTGQPDIAADIAVSANFVTVGRAALEAGAPIFTDSNMVAAGVTRARLPRENSVICTLRNAGVAELALQWKTTRSAAALAFWEEKLSGAVVAIGNAPTALFHLLEWIADGGPRPAVIIGVPVGFIGAAESKVALANFRSDTGIDLPYLTVHGRRGGSAIAASALNALAQEQE